MVCGPQMTNSQKATKTGKTKFSNLSFFISLKQNFTVAFQETKFNQQEQNKRKNQEEKGAEEDQR